MDEVKVLGNYECSYHSSLELRLLFLFPKTDEAYGHIMFCMSVANKSGTRCKIFLNCVLCSADVQVQASYYNDRVGAWEPLIEPHVEEENVYRPWEMSVKVLHNITIIAVKTDLSLM